MLAYFVLCFLAVGVFAEPNGPKVTEKVSNFFLFTAISAK